MLNIGIIGPGRVAERHAVALKETTGAQLWSVCSYDLNKAQAFATKHNALATLNAFDDVSKMLDDPKLDAVIIATPDKLHVTHILLALKAGKSILVEKPVCTSLDACEKILTAYQQSQITLAVGYHLRWHQGLRRITQKAHKNELGNLHHIKLHWGVNFIEHAKWRVDPELGEWVCLSILGTHLIDIARWIMIPLCGEVSEIKSFIKTADNGYSDGTVSIIMSFKSGATAEIFCSVLFDLPFNLEIYAEKNNVVGMDLTGQAENRKITVGNDPLIFETSNPYVSQLNNFIEAIIEKRQPEVSLEEGLENVRNLVFISDHR
ncbi:MAG: Gfo/Idh/MocA family oxidoreductase [Proteobacteria bacterium]|nr:Gfo/Idh/MocA family oxidoreductase [Pseudomonadota bacterium]